MEVVLGSQNAAKVQATSAAFKTAYPDMEIDLRTVDADSGVSAHPLTGQESLQGALNRVAHARQLAPDTDYYVAIEGGLLEVETRVYLLGWAAVVNREGRVATGLSSGPELQGKLLEAAKAGKDLNQALGEQLDMYDVGTENGFCGLVTGDAITRSQADSQAVLFALAQFCYPHYFS